MQIRYPIDLTIKEYIEQKAWEQAELNHCPFHPDDGCGFARHGTYLRKLPTHCLVVRYNCSDAHQITAYCQIFFASRLPGTLDEVEHAVNIVSCRF